jgi:predicted MFS family arabinose efflux permease
VAVVGCVVFSLAGSFSALLAGRVLVGAGVSACLMAPLTGYRRWFTPMAQMRANAWMLMTGSIGMVASTLPVQWLLPLAGWRPLFWGLAVLIVLAMGWMALAVPAWPSVSHAASLERALPSGYAAVWQDRYFQRLAPLGFFCYGGMVAMQTLWAGPWMQNVAGQTAAQAATGLFWINMAMLATFWSWGMVNPWLLRRGLDANSLMAWGLPSSLLVLAGIVVLGPQAGAGAWALFCVCSTFVSLSLPALAMTFPQALAGRALSAYNLVIFLGVFVVQWGVGLAVDGFVAAGLGTVAAYQSGMALFLACNGGAYAWFVWRGRSDNADSTAPP